MHFTDLGLSAGLLRAIGEQGYDTPTPIQAQAIPHVLAGSDLEALAQTGTGKTAAFVLPILQKLTSQTDSPLERVSRNRPRALILVPTRELAAQVQESVRTYGKHVAIRSLAVFGGVGMQPQVTVLRRGVDIVVATPGRLLDHITQRTIDLGAVQTLVLDEADRMLDMGFIRDIRKIIERLPKQRQNLMFSATFAPEVRELAHTVLRNPVLVEVARRNTTIELVTQSVIPVDKDKKRELLLHLFENHGWHQTLVFTRTKHGADALSRKLDQAGIRSAAIHGDKTQGARTRALADFKSGKLAALVATDIAARGIDIDQLPRVINFELPNVPEDYVHRIGRTGRAGSEGEALSLVSHDERIQLRDIERLIKKDLDKSIIVGFEPSANPPREPAKAKPQPRRQGSGGGNGARSGAPRSGAPGASRNGSGARGQRDGAAHHNGQRHR
ncbi:MAG: DEAD/DEAH box helicase [Rhodocyclaceae bacterium]|nr:MAG: DEAD/DEAH box helicase [Rhodocyclaceae bacterium]